MLFKIVSENNDLNPWFEDFCTTIMIILCREKNALEGYNDRNNLSLTKHLQNSSTEVIEGNSLVGKSLVQIYNCIDESSFISSFIIHKVGYKIPNFVLWPAMERHQRNRKHNMRFGVSLSFLGMRSGSKIQPVVIASSLILCKRMRIRSRG